LLSLIEQLQYPVQALSILAVVIVLTHRNQASVSRWRLIPHDTKHWWPMQAIWHDGAPRRCGL